MFEGIGEGHPIEMLGVGGAKIARISAFFRMRQILNQQVTRRKKRFLEPSRIGDAGGPEQKPAEKRGERGACIFLQAKQQILLMNIAASLRLHVGRLHLPPPLAGRAPFARAEYPGKIAGAGKSGLGGDGFDFEVGFRKQTHGDIDLGVCKYGAGALAANGDEEAAEMAGGDVDCGGDVLDAGLLPEVMAEPGDGFVHFFRDAAVGGAGGGGGDAAEGQEGEIDDGAVEAEFAQGVAVVKIGLEGVCKILDLAALGLGEGADEKALGGDGFDELPGDGAAMDDGDAAMAALAMPAVDVVGREDPETGGAEGEFLAGVEQDAAASFYDGVKLPVQPRMQADGHRPKTTDAAAEVSKHGWLAQSKMKGSREEF